MRGNMEETVSVIIPVFNVEKYIEQTIDCVCAQTYKRWELLLVTDGCTDHSEQVIRNYQEKTGDDRIRLIRQPGNLGAAQARNRGLCEANGRYIAYLDSDDLWKPEKLEHQLLFMKKKDVAFSFTGYEFADENAQGTGKVVEVPAALTYREALRNTTIFTTTVMFDTYKINKEMLVMPQIKSEDTALWWSILRNGYTAYGLNENLALYRRAGRTLSSNKLEAMRRIWNLYRKSEGLSLLPSICNFCFWAVRAVKRRV